MRETKRPINTHRAYHAHVYFDETTARFAKKLCEKVSTKFKLSIGHFHTQALGPHPCWSCQITFGTKDFNDLIPWLDTHRQKLTILVHALTGDDIKDHTDFAYWLGDSVELNLDFFKEL